MECPSLMTKSKTRSLKIVGIWIKKYLSISRDHLQSKIIYLYYSEIVDRNISFDKISKYYFIDTFLFIYQQFLSFLF